MKIRITKDIRMDYAPPVGAVLDVREDAFRRDGIYPVEFRGNKVMILGDECEVIEDTNTKTK